MDHERFRDWFSHVDDLTAAQREEVAAALSGRPQGAASLATIELGVDEERRCAHCGSGGSVSRGKARGLRRYRCKACGKTFGALTGTALSGLHHKERWLSFGESLAEGETIRASAARCGIAPSTAHRWRHRFLEAVRQAPDRLAGIVEADETFVLESRKGERKLNRKPRRRGGKARKRGLSREQVPILVAADRTGATLSHTLPALNADSVREALEPVIARMPCSSRTPAAAIRPPLRRSPSLMRASTAPPASVCAAPCTSRRSTAATARSRGFCEPSAASPPRTSTATSGGSISSNSATGHPRERVSRRQWPDHAYVSRIEPISTGYARERPSRISQRNRSRWLGAGVSVILPLGFTVGGGGEYRRANYESGWFPFVPDGSARKDTTRILRASVHNRAFTLVGFSPELVLVREERTTNAQLYDYKRTRGELRFVRQF